MDKEEKSMPEITLDTPVTWDGKTIDKLTLSPLKGKDLIDTEREIRIIRISRGTPVTDELPIENIESLAHNVAKAAGVPYEVIESLASPDFHRVINRGAAFLLGRPARKTSGESPSDWPEKQTLQ